MGKLQLLKLLDNKIELFEQASNQLMQEFTELREFVQILSNYSEKKIIHDQILDNLTIRDLVMSEWEKVIKIKISLIEEQATLLDTLTNFD